MSTYEFFQSHRFRKYGRHNPELIENQYWLWLTKMNLSPYQAMDHFRIDRNLTSAEADWCFSHRSGMSVTKLDAKIISIGGRYEGEGDKLFAIYNDVIVSENGVVTSIFGYPPEIFPPTDYHTATKHCDKIIIIGGMRYKKDRVYGTTPMHILNLSDYSVDTIINRGSPPGWLYEHSSELICSSKILISGGIILEQHQGSECFVINTQEYIYDINSSLWESLAKDVGSQYIIKFLTNESGIECYPSGTIQFQNFPSVTGYAISFTDASTVHKFELLGTKVTIYDNFRSLNVLFDDIMNGAEEKIIDLLLRAIKDSVVENCVAIKVR